MNSQELCKNNIAIAKFMGWQVIQESDAKYFSIYKANGKKPISIKSVIGYTYESSAWCCIANHCNYHLDWNWLIPVVEKIASQDLSSIDIHWGTGCTDSFAWCQIDYNVGKRNFKTSEDLNSDEQSLITAVYLAVVEFIKWFNQK